MAKNRQIESVEKRLSRNTTKTYTQVVHTAPARVFVTTYLTKKGKRLMNEASPAEKKAIIFFEIYSSIPLRLSPTN